MPIAHIYLMEGRTDDQVQALISKVTEAIHESLGAPVQSVRVVVQEVPKTHFGIGGESAKALGR